MARYIIENGAVVFQNVKEVSPGFVPDTLQDILARNCFRSDLEATAYHSNGGPGGENAELVPMQLPCQTSWMSPIKPCKGKMKRCKRRKAQ